MATRSAVVLEKPHQPGNVDIFEVTNWKAASRFSERVVSAVALATLR